MLFDSLNYVEMSIHGADNRNKIVEVAKIKDYLPNGGSDHYACLFRYESTLKKYVEEHGSVKGHDLPHYADYITFDIDDKENVDRARQSALALMAKLEGLGITDNMVTVSFSGAKGFHIQIPSSLFNVEPDTGNSKYMRNLCLDIAGDVKIDTGIYDKNRLFRLCNTKNSKSGLYKVNIEPSMLLQPMEAILAYAEKPQPPRRVQNSLAARERLVAMWKKAKAARERKTIASAPSLVDVPRYAKACIHKILQGVPNGMIHNAAFRIANHFHKQGYPANVIRGILEGWGPLNEVPAEENFQRMAEEAGSYDFGCNDDLLQSFCSDRCYLFKKPTASVDDIMDMEAQYMAYVEYIRTLKQKCFVTGHQLLDSMIRGVAPGEVMIIIAYSGTFKSALLQHLLLKAGQRTGMHHLFFSLEMPVSRVFERSVQMTCELEGYKIENSFRDSEQQKEFYKEMMAHRADRLLVCQKSGVTLEQIHDYTVAAREKYGELGAIGIDYLGLMSAPGKQDEYSRISHCAEQSKKLAKDLNLPVILLSQVNRATAGGDVEKSSAKGSGAIEASADFLIGLQRDAEDQLILRLLKNRKGLENVDFTVEMERDYLKFVKLQMVKKENQSAEEQPKKTGKKRSTFKVDDDACPY